MDLLKEKTEIKIIFSEDTEMGLKILGEKLSPKSPKFNEFIQLKTAYTAHKVSGLKGVLSFEEKALGFNRNVEAFIEFIDRIESSDLTVGREQFEQIQKEIEQKERRTEDINTIKNCWEMRTSEGLFAAHFGFIGLLAIAKISSEDREIAGYKLEALQELEKENSIGKYNYDQSIYEKERARLIGELIAFLD